MAWGLALTMYEKMGVVGYESLADTVDYVKQRIDPDAIPELQAALIERDARYEVDHERDPFDQFGGWG